MKKSRVLIGRFIQVRSRTADDSWGLEVSSFYPLGLAPELKKEHGIGAIREVRLKVRSTIFGGTHQILECSHVNVFAPRESFGQGYCPICRALGSKGKRVSLTILAYDQGDIGMD